MDGDKTRDAGASVFKPALIITAGRTLGFAASFIMPIILVRLFSRSEFGTYKQLFLIYTSLYSLAQCGMAESLIYFLPGGGRESGHFVVNSVAGLALMGSVCLGLLVVLAPRIATLFHNPVLTADVPLIGTFLLLMLVAATLEIVMMVKNRHVLAFFSYSLSDVARTVLCVAPAALLGGLRGLLYGAVLFAGLRCVCTLGYLYAEYRSELGFSVRQLRAQLVYALPFALAVAIDIAQNNVHFYMVSSYFNAATYAIYAVGCLQIPLVDHLMTSTCNVMMVRMRERPHAATALAVWRDTTRKLTMVFAPLVAVLLVVAHRLITVLFTSRYARSVPIFMVWSCSLLLPALLTDGVLRVYAQNRFLILINTTKLVIVAVSIEWALTKFGLVGAVLSTLLAAVVAKTVSLVRVRRLLQCTVRQLLPWLSLGIIGAIAAAATVPAIFAQETLALSAIPLLIVTAGIYAVIYTGALLAFGPLRDAERRTLIRWACGPALRLLRYTA